MDFPLDSLGILTKATYEDLDHHISKEILQKLRLLMEKSPPQKVSLPTYTFRNGQFVLLEGKAILIYQDRVYRSDNSHESLDLNCEGSLTYD